MKRDLYSDNAAKHANRKHANPEVPAAPHYDFDPLIEREKDLQKYAKRNASGEWNIDFSSRGATLALTCAILKHHFRLSLSLPSGHLVPTIPNRVQYMSWAGGLLGKDAPKQPLVLLDIGTGPSCIYPMLGSRMFPRWSFIATDSDHTAVYAAQRNCEDNSLSAIKVIQTDDISFFPEVVLAEKPDLTICNPPFHDGLPNVSVPAGTEAQLRTDGGELAFLCKLAQESRRASHIKWFTSLVGRKVDLPKIVRFLQSNQVRSPVVKTAELCQGGRTTRWAVAWSFGEDISTLSISTDPKSKWRCVITVKPGRKYANHLVCQDILGITCSAFHTLGWKQLPLESKASNPYTVLLGVSDTEEQESVELQVDCVPKKSSGEFEIHIKVNKRGTSSPEFFQDLGNSAVSHMSAILNE